MKALPRLVFVIGAASSLPAATPTADDVLAQARKALGGAEKLATVKSLTATGTYQRIPPAGTIVANPNGPAKKGPPTITGTREINFLLPDQYAKSDAASNGPGVTSLEGLSDGKGWTDFRLPPGAQGTVSQPTPGPGLDRQMKEALTRYLLAWTLSAAGVQFTYAGEAESPDGMADVLDAKGPDDLSIRIFVDRKSHFPLMLTYRSRVATGPPPLPAGGGPPDFSKTPMKDVEIQMHLSEYASVNGIRFPKVIIWSMDGQTSEQFEVTKYTVNPSLKPEKFRK